MPSQSQLPPEHMAHVTALEAAYLESEDLIAQSGFHGGAERWRREREPILDAVEGAGDIVDVGCANGYLVECLVQWAGERGFRLTPHGVDIGPRLIAEARRRLPAFAANFEAANGWDWRPARRFRYVYALYDCVPAAYVGEYANRLLARAVVPGGRLVMGAYGSRSRGEAPLDIAGVLRSHGLRVSGESAGGRPPLTRFAWVDKM